jgi:hypothetical protein
MSAWQCWGKCGLQLPETWGTAAISKQYCLSCVSQFVKELQEVCKMTRRARSYEYRATRDRKSLAREEMARELRMY